MTKYTVFIEPTTTGYSAYVPDLPGCVAAATTLEDTRQLIKEAFEFHIEGMRINGETVPEPTPHIEQVELSASRIRH
jgi:predicted RNase H-like HicB family nuclease